MTDKQDEEKLVFSPKEKINHILYLRKQLRLYNIGKEREISEEDITKIRKYNEELLCGSLKESFTLKEKRSLIVLANTGLVVKIRNVLDKYIYKNPDLIEETLSEGRNALMKAMDKYDCSKKGYENKTMKFSSYAFNIIRTQIRREVLQKSNNVSIPESVISRNRKNRQSGEGEIVQIYETSDELVLDSIEDRTTDFEKKVENQNLIIQGLLTLKKKNLKFFNKNIDNILHYRDFSVLEKKGIIDSGLFTLEEMEEYYKGYPLLEKKTRDGSFISSRTKFSDLIKQAIKK